jgi:hypothetical protein
MTEMLFEIGGEARNLFALIVRRDGNKDRFVEATADELDLSGGDEGIQTYEILGAMLFDPSEQRTGIMQAHMDARMLFEEVDKRKIGVFVGFFEDVTEIAAWLMGVNEQNEMKALGHGGSFSLRHHTVCRKIADSGR